MRKWIAGGLFLLTVLLYAQTGSYGFLGWDDPLSVTENEQVLRGLTAESVQWALTTHFVYWQPLVYLSHMAMVSAFGLDGGAHHWLNVLLHAANVALWFLILTRFQFPLWTAAIAAAIYGWHPLRVESVAWITERRDVLVGLMWLLTIWFYIDYAESQRDRRKYFLVVLFCALALMAKPVAVTLPLVLLLLDFWPLGRLDRSKWRECVIEKIPLVALAVACAFMALVGQRAIGAVSVGLPFDLRLLNAIRSYAVYLAQTVWPVDLSPFYAIPSAHPAWQIILSGALFAGLSWGAWRSWKTQPWFAVAWAWYVVVLAPNIGIIQVGEQAHADRYSYLPTMMLIAAVFYGRGKNVLFAGGVASVILLLASFGQTKYWKDNFTLYGRMIEVDPRTPTGHSNLGYELQRLGRHAEAIPHFEAAALHSPGHVESRINAAISFLAMGQPDKALPMAEAAVKLEPAKADGHLYLGQALAGVKRIDEAKQALAKGLALSPSGEIKAHLLMQTGAIQYVEGQDEAALASFRAVLAAFPQFAQARKNAGIVLGNLGRNQEAIAELEKYLVAQPDDAAVRQAIDALREEGAR